MPHNYERDTELPDERNSVSFFFAIAVLMLLLQRRVARASAGRSPQQTVVTLRNVRQSFSF